MDARVVVAGRFAIRRAAGTGGTGRVFEAVDLVTGDAVALKLMHEPETPREIERFTRESETLAALRHPGIVRYVAHGETEAGEGYLAMEWLDGVDLRRRLETRHLSLAETMALARRAADALAVAHALGVVHRDLKPRNLFLVGGDVAQVKVIDFGVAGTPMYMAPEQARGERDVGPAADVFSLGCILYECIAGRPPFAADHIAALLARILLDEARPLDAVAPHAPAALSALIARMLAKDPRARPRDAAELRDELDALAAVQQQPHAPAHAITSSEPYLVSVVVARPYGDARAATPPLDPAALAQVHSQHEHLGLLLRPLGVRVEGLADGTLVAASVQAQRGDAADLAVQVARWAIVIRDRWPEAVVALATARAEADASGRVPVGDAIDRAVRLARRGLPSPPGDDATAGAVDGVLIDELGAELLRPRFVTATVRDDIVLTGESLEELVRTAPADQGDRLPETVLAILRARLSRLDAQTRRLLRAGAVFGATFSRGGAAELCGLPIDSPEIDACLALAVGEELIERDGRFTGEARYTFRHALMRDAAYGLSDPGVSL